MPSKIKSPPGAEHREAKDEAEVFSVGTFIRVLSQLVREFPKAAEAQVHFETHHNPEVSTLAIGYKDKINVVLIEIEGTQIEPTMVDIVTGLRESFAEFLHERDKPEPDAKPKADATPRAAADPRNPKVH